MKVLLPLFAVATLLSGVLLAVRGSTAGGPWDLGGVVEAAGPVRPPPAPGPVLTGPVRSAPGPLRLDPARHDEFLRRLLLPQAARGAGAPPDARLLDYFLEHDPSARRWETPPVDPKAVS